MVLALLIIALALGIVLGGLLLLRRTANMQPPIPKRDPSVKRSEADKDEDENDSW